MLRKSINLVILFTICVNIGYLLGTLVKPEDELNVLVCNDTKYSMLSSVSSDYDNKVLTGLQLLSSVQVLSEMNYVILVQSPTDSNLYYNYNSKARGAEMLDSSYVVRMQEVDIEKCIPTREVISLKDSQANLLDSSKDSYVQSVYSSKYICNVIKDETGTVLGLLYKRWKG